MIDMNKTYRYRNGEPARVLCTDRTLRCWPVVSLGEEGDLRYHGENGRVGATDNQWDLIEVSPYDHLRDGDVIEVESNGGYWLHRFAGISELGLVLVYSPDRETYSLSSNANVRLICRKENEE